MSPIPAERSAKLPEPGDRIEDGDVWVEVYARAHLPTAFGEFQIFVFRNSEDDKEHVALVRGDGAEAGSPLVRVHSECLTGDVLGSLRCDCRAQLEKALGELGQIDNGALVYMRQEGRGIGLGNKVRAYALQERGLDTYEANQHLGFDDDHRDYHTAALMLRLLGFDRVRLATNNPRKVFGLKQHDVHVEARVPLFTGLNEHNSDYLAAKAKKSGHLLPF